MRQPVYHSQDIQAWEQRWFGQQNSSYGLMKQVAWTVAQRLIPIFQNNDMQRIAICCGKGNNAGDGYLVAKYLLQVGFGVDIYAVESGSSLDLYQAEIEAREAGLKITSGFAFYSKYDVYIDALFGIGLNRELNDQWQTVIQNINAQTGLKIALDIPSGLNANTGQPLPCAIKADYTLTVFGLKAGLFTGQAKEFCGQIQVIDILPIDQELKPIAQLSSNK
nr:NAD(P)H-hydrate epimerase [Acinetobacter sp.]